MNFMIVCSKYHSVKTRKGTTPSGQPRHSPTTNQYIAHTFIHTNRYTLYIQCRGDKERMNKAQVKNNSNLLGIYIDFGDKGRKW